MSRENVESRILGFDGCVRYVTFGGRYISKYPRRKEILHIDLNLLGKKSSLKSTASIGFPPNIGRAGVYRFGFNGKENDNEVKGDGGQQDYGMRVYDTRLGKFLSADPLSSVYPWYSLYQFAGNTPIQAIDVDGMEPGPPGYIEMFNGYILSKIQNPNSTEVVHFVNASLAHPAVSMLISCSFGPLNGVSYMHISGNAKNPAVKQYYAKIAKEEFKGLVIGMGIGFTLSKLMKVSAPLLRKTAKPVKNEINTNLLKTEGIEVWSDEEAVKYLKAQKADAAYISIGEKDGILILKPGYTEQELLEEIIHHNQKKLYGEREFLNNQYKYEIEAQDELLKIGEHQGWSVQEMDRIRAARDMYIKKMAKEKKG